MELVSKEKMLEKLAMVPADQFYNVASIRNFIKAEEEAVTRCKDCKWRETGACTIFTPDNWFCPKGERKEG